LVYLQNAAEREEILRLILSGENVRHEALLFCTKIHSQNIFCLFKYVVYYKGEVAYIYLYKKKKKKKK